MSALSESAPFAEQIARSATEADDGARTAEERRHSRDVGRAVGEMVERVIEEEMARTAVAPIALSPSKIQRLRRCHRLFYFEDILGREPVSRPWGETDFGSVFHRGAEALYQGGDALEAVDSAGVDEHGVSFSPPKDPYERAAARAILKAYTARYGAEDRAFTVAGVELQFEHDARHPVTRRRVPTVRTRGRIDLVWRGRAAECPECEGAGGSPSAEVEDAMPCLTCGGKGEIPSTALVVVDHKTTGSKLGKGTLSDPPPHLTAGAEIRIQAGIYVDAIHELGMGVPEAFAFDYVRRPEFDERLKAPKPKKDGTPTKPKTEACEACRGAKVLDGGVKCAACKGTGRIELESSKVKHGETPYEYENRLVELIARDPAEWFYRHVVEVTPALVRETRANVLDSAAEIRWRTARSAWPMNDASCTSFNNPCAWLPVCTGGQSPEDGTLYRLKRKEEVER